MTRKKWLILGGAALLVVVLVLVSVMTSRESGLEVEYEPVQRRDLVAVVSAIHLTSGEAQACAQVEAGARFATPLAEIGESTSARTGSCRLARADKSASATAIHNRFAAPITMASVPTRSPPRSAPRRPTAKSTGNSALVCAGEISASSKMPTLVRRSIGTTEIFLTDVRVPASARLGEEGAGFKIAMYALDKGRVSVAAGSTSVARTPVPASSAARTSCIPRRPNLAAL